MTLTLIAALLITAWLIRRRTLRCTVLNVAETRDIHSQINHWWIHQSGPHSLTTALTKEQRDFRDAEFDSTRRHLDTVPVGPLVAAAAQANRNARANLGPHNGITHAEAEAIIASYPTSRIGRALNPFWSPVSIDDLVQFASEIPPTVTARTSIKEVAGGASKSRTTTASANHASAPSRDTTPSAPTIPRRQNTADDARAALDALLDEWARYELDIEAFYIDRPLLHDVTGTVAPTVAYNEAIQALSAAVDELHPGSPQQRIDVACELADRAWAAWHHANDHAALMGLGDRTPTERKALERLGKLVARLTRTAAADPEAPGIIQQIHACLDRISTVSVSWATISTLPAIEASGVLRALPQAEPDR